MALIMTRGYAGILLPILKREIEIVGPMTHLSPSKNRKRHATTLLLALFVVVPMLAPTIAAHEIVSGEYTASKQWPVDCPGSESSAALSPFGGSAFITAPSAADEITSASSAEAQASTASFSGRYPHEHSLLSIAIDDDIAGANGSTVTVCTYDSDGNLVTSVTAEAPLTIYAPLTPHRSFLAWVEPVHVEQHDLSVTFASSGSYTWQTSD